MRLLALFAAALALFASGCGGKFTAPPMPGTTDSFLLEADPIYWPEGKTTLTYAIEETTSQIGVDMVGQVDKGIHAWDEAIKPNSYGGVTLVRTDDLETADIVVRFGTRDQVGGKYGNTRYEYADVHKTMIKRAYTYINRGLVFELLKDTATHEFAHCLGWRSHVNDKTSIMGKAGIEFWKGVTRKDGNTVYLLTHPGARNGK